MLNTLYYTDAVSDEEPVFSPYLDAMKRKKWLFEAYADHYSHTTFTSMQELTGPKTYLLKLIEFNKIALIEKAPSTGGQQREDWWCTASDPNVEERDLIEIQICMTRLMR